MNKSILQMLPIIFIPAIFECNTLQKGDMSLVVLSYRQGAGIEQHMGYRDEAVKNERTDRSYAAILNIFYKII